MIIPFYFLLWHLVAPAQAQETLSLKECREMALKYNKEMAASVKQTESAHYTAKSYKGNFFPNLTASGTGLYSNADGSYGIAGGNLPVFLPDATGQFNPGQPSGFAYFPGINLDYKIGWVYMGGIQLEQPLYMGGKIRAAYKMSLLGKEMAQMNETLTATEVILKTDQAYALVVKAKEMKTVADTYHAVLAELQKNVESAYKHGLKPQNDVLKVQVKLNESELGIRKAENALRLATMNLCHLIGKPLTTEILISGDFPEIEQEMELQVLDITRRPEYGILDKQVAIARQQVKLNRSELLPKVGIKGSYDYVHGLELNEKNFLDNASFSVLLNVSIPLSISANAATRYVQPKPNWNKPVCNSKSERANATGTDPGRQQSGRSETGKRTCRPFPAAGGREPTRQQKPVRSRAGNSVRPSGSPSTMATGIRNPSGCPFPTLPELCGLSESSRDFT